MLIGEPPRSGGDVSFALFGIPVRVHPFFWLIVVMLGIGLAPTLLELLIWVVAAFISVLIHELGHALVLRYFGIWPWITLYGFGGIASYHPGEAQRVGTMGHVAISFAGPGAQFLLVGLLAGILTALGYPLFVSNWGPVVLVMPADTVVSFGLTRLLDDLMIVSVFWGALNLLPIYPLDGGQIARHLFVAVNPRTGIDQSLILSIVAASAMVVVGLSARSFFMMLMFGFLAYGSYTALQAYRNHRGW